MGFFDAMKGSGNSSGKEEVRPSPVREFLGQELFVVDCRGANLYVHENAVVIDKTDYGIWEITISRLFLLNPLLRYRLS